MQVGGAAPYGRWAVRIAGRQLSEGIVEKVFAFWRQREWEIANWVAFTGEEALDLFVIIFSLNI